jgi:predicted amidohydrolase
MQDLKILGIQSDLVWESPKTNRLAFEQKIGQNFNDHDLIVLPETFTTGFPVDPGKFSEEINDSTFRWMKKMASGYKTTICGSFLLNNDGNYSNSLIWMRPDGSFECYDKRHVFSMGGEHEKISAGEKHLIVELKGWKIKPMICYDLRFPVWSKNSFSQQSGFEYDMAIYIANWPAVRSYPWRSLLVARAIENLACVIGVNRVGFDNAGIAYDGDSMFLDAKGNIMQQAKKAEEYFLTDVFKFEDLLSFRQKFNPGPDWDDYRLL